jgi:hypothetical protein
MSSKPFLGMARRVLILEMEKMASILRALVMNTLHKHVRIAKGRTDPCFGVVNKVIIVHRKKKLTCHQMLHTALGLRGIVNTVMNLRIS